MTNKKFYINIEPVKKLLNKHKIHKKAYLVEIDGIKLKMLPEVFCPAYTNTSKFLADNIKIKKDDKVLDMFSGSGYVAIAISKKAKYVICADHSSNAIKCINTNICINGLTEKINAIQSDLFKNIDNETFDVIIANPPLLPGTPKTILETAVFDPVLNTTKKFLTNVSKYLKNDGRIYLLFSDVTKDSYLGGLEYIYKLCIKNNLKSEIIAERNVGYESYFVIEIKKKLNNV